MMSQVSNSTLATNSARPTRRTPAAALRPAMWLGVAGSVILAVLGVVQADSIGERIRGIEEPYIGVAASADSGGFLVTAVLIVAALNLIGWVAAVTVFGNNLRRARIWGVFGLIVGLSLAATMLNVEEYGERVYAMHFGLLALVPSIAGIWGLVALFRRR